MVISHLFLLSLDFYKSSGGAVREPRFYRISDLLKFSLCIVIIYILYLLCIYIYAGVLITLSYLTTHGF